MRIIGLKSALNSNKRFKYKPPEDLVDHIVVGGGVVGLAIARQLLKTYPHKSTYLVERNSRAGEETSSRNSEVIHGGLYYPPGSLKEQLCIRGRRLLYDYCKSSSVPYRKSGKLVVAREDQRQYIQSLYQKCVDTRWPQQCRIKEGEVDDSPAIPVRLISGDEARELEPDLSPEIVAALLSNETGIIDSHTLMESLERDISESDNGELVYSTSVVRVDPYSISLPIGRSPTKEHHGQGWVVQMVTGDVRNAASGDAFLAHNLINASGLNGALILNSLLPDDDGIPMFYARGSYASYNGPGVESIRRLIYPCPEGEHSFQSLGTHLTLDMNGKIKFGPDIQWISPEIGPVSQTDPFPIHGPLADTRGNIEEYLFDEDQIDFWKRHLIPDDVQLDSMYHAVRRYLPGVVMEKFQPDYVGIRPKLVPPWGGFQDFVIRKDSVRDFLSIADKQQQRQGLMISLMGIESPGLTASLAIAEEVVDTLD